MDSKNLNPSVVEPGDLLARARDDAPLGLDVLALTASAVSSAPSRETEVPLAVDLEPSASSSDLPSPAPWSDAATLSKEEAESAGQVLEALGTFDPEDLRLETIDDPRIPADQMYFKIGEVARITGIKAYVLRYWEAEFPWIRPEKTSSKQRRYRRQDIALLLQIARLRYEEQLTIDQARQVIREDRKQEGGSPRTRARRAQRSIPTSRPPVETTSSDLAGQLALTLSGVARSTQVQRALAEMRKTVLELLEAVEE